MANEEYSIHYDQREDVTFPSQTGMTRYLKREMDAWSPLLDHVRNNLNANLVINHGRTSFTPDQLASTLETLIKRLDNRTEFNRSTAVGLHEGSLLPPPSDSLEGQLILGLLESNMAAEAMAAYVYFLAEGVNVHVTPNDAVGKLIQRGKILVDAAPIVKALPFSRVSNSKMAASVRTAENHVQSLADEVVSAQESNNSHDAELQVHLDEQKKKAERINDVILRLNRRRERQRKLWIDETDKLVEEKFEEARKKVRIFELNSKRAEQKRVKEFEHLQSLFKTQLRLRAPVKLWETREEKHSQNSRSAMKKIVCAGVLAIAFGLVVPFAFGDYIANSFVQTICKIPASNVSTAVGCERVFSAKGPVTITGLLLVMSLLMWMARLQYRVHLSERHLALDASEKKAFTETYLAMKEGREVNIENEAIVLASLFRPTQDGIIRDDEAGMDLSAVALMAKQFSRNS